MPKVTLTFEGENWADVEGQILAMGFNPSDSFPDEPPRDDVERPVLPAAADPEQEGPPPAPPKPKKAAKAAPPPGAAGAGAAFVPLKTFLNDGGETAVAVRPEPELPSLDSLKAFITQAVRAGQKGEGPQKINDLLPAFKQKTGLDFIMNAEEKHRVALRDLAVEAGLA